MSSLLQYKCPKCGGNIEFDSSVQKPVCSHCGTEFNAADLEAFDKELKNEGADNINWQSENERWAEEDAEKDGMKVYICDSCGGEIITEETTAAMKCPWCDSPIVIKGSVAGSLRPDYVLPFKLDKDAAKEKYREHLTGKKFLPKVFSEENHLDEIKGVYVPYWLFDAEADGTVRFRATQKSTWTAGDTIYHETRHYALIRNGALAFDNIPVDASLKMADDLTESLEPFDYSGMEKFRTAYLSGYLADKYSVNIDESIPRANKRIKNSFEETLKSTTVGYLGVMPEKSNVNVREGKILYALLPIWVLNTTWNGQKFVFAMNGQTGKFVGNLPLDKKAMWRYFFKWFGIIGLASAAALLLLYSLTGLL